MDLPVDIWWKILTYIWDEDKSPYSTFNHMKHDSSYPFPSSVISRYRTKVGLSVSSDLLIFRRLCKTTKKMVEKYTTRYKSVITRVNYMIIFKYSNSQ